ncbi:MAG: elongation factor 4 [Planctomycetales bacterium]|nr:translation elongation factor 4 [bacterium]UNM07736.1 MAG: elongation factor 4 [Planctomycetales bacterium]
MTDLKLIRNFCIIAHIDHGKSTLADRFIDVCGAVEERKMKDQVLDRMDLERERGITIKLQAVRLNFLSRDGNTYELNLIDTPGHVDFAYEVSRSLKACEGAILLVDAAQGIEAQTLANLYLALDADLEIIPVLNKIDLPVARPDEVAAEICSIIGGKPEDVLRASGKTGDGVQELLEEVIKRVDPPKGDSESPLRALIFDSHFDKYRGVVTYCRVFDGKISARDQLMMMSTGRKYEVGEVGIFSPEMMPVKDLSAGEVGYVVSGIKSVGDSRVGDTITTAANPASAPIEGYAEAQSLVFCSFYPTQAEDVEELKKALEKLQLNDAALHFEQESSEALGFGFRCGFLGLLHMEIVQERLEREYDIDLVITSPSVVYHVYMKSGDMLTVDNPSKYPDLTKIDHIEEPTVKASIIVPSKYFSQIIELAKKKRGEFLGSEYIGNDRMNLSFRLPLADILYDFYDNLKTISRGLASFEYHFDEYQQSDLVKVDILVNGEKAEALSFICHRSDSHYRGRKVVEKLQKTIRRHQFQIPLQAAIGNTMIARMNIAPLRKDVTSKCYGGDISRKRKLLERQKKGKARMKMIGNVDIPQDAFLSVLTYDQAIKGNKDD